MKTGIILFSLALIASKTGLAGPGDFSVANLPNTPAEDFPVCYDQSTGTLGNCVDEPMFSDVLEVSVTCPGQSVQDAIDNAPVSGWLKLSITGTCAENVEIRRSHTVLDGGGVGKIQGQQADAFAVEVIYGTNNVYLANLIVSDGVGSGILANQGSVIRMESCKVENNAGGVAVAANFGSKIDVAGGNTISAGGMPAIGSYGSSAVRIRGSANSISNQSTNSATITTSRQSSVEIRDTQTITNVDAADGLAYALAAYNGSSILQHRGFAAINGHLTASNLSSIMIGDALIAGGGWIGTISTMRFWDEDDGVDGTSSMHGSLGVGGGVATFSDSFTMNENVVCEGGSVSGSPTFTGEFGFVGCE